MSNLVLVDSNGIAHAVASRVTPRNGLTVCGYAGIVSMKTGEVTCPDCLAALLPEPPIAPVPHFKARGTQQWTARQCNCLGWRPRPNSRSNGRRREVCHGR